MRMANSTALTLALVCWRCRRASASRSAGEGERCGKVVRSVGANFSTGLGMLFTIAGEQERLLSPGEPLT
jgi:hypothetical protein